MCPYDAILPNHRSVQHRGSDPNQRIFADGAPMKSRSMADGDPGPNRKWHASIGVQHGPVLYVRPDVVIRSSQVMSRTVRIRLLQMHHNIAWTEREHDHGISHLSPIVIGSGLSPRTVAPNQTDDCSNIITFPPTRGCDFGHVCAKFVNSFHLCVSLVKGAFYL